MPETDPTVAMQSETAVQETDQAFDPEQSTDYGFADVFGDQAGGDDNPTEQTDQADQGTDGEATPETEPNQNPDEPPSATEGLVEVDLGDGKRVKMTAEAAEAYQRQSRDYLELQREFTRRNQQARTDPPADTRPAEDGEAQYQQFAKRFDQDIYKSLMDRDGQGVTQLIDSIVMDRVNRLSDAKIAAVEQRFQAILEQSGLPQVILKNQANSAMEAFEAKHGIQVGDRDAVLARAIAIAEGGRPSEADLFKAALLIAKTAPQTPKPATAATPKPRPAAPQGSGFAPTAPVTATRPQSPQQKVVHRQSDPWA